jgi:hypothetical protein
MPLSLAVFGILFVFFFVLEWRVLRALLRQDPEWRREMKATPRPDRRRIARAVRDGRPLDDPREARLAAGMAEQRLALSRSIGRRTRWLRVALGVGLVLLGALAGSITVILLGALFVVLGAATRPLDGREQAAQ